MQENKNDEFEAQEVDDMLLGFFGKGGTLKELKNMSDDAMEAIYSIGYSLYNNEKYDKAQDIFQFLCFYDHFNQKYFIGLGSCQMMLQQYQGAIDLFSFAAVLDSENPKPMLYLGDCHLKNNDKEKAKIAYEVCIESGKNNKIYQKCVDRAKSMLKSC